MPNNMFEFLHWEWFIWAYVLLVFYSRLS